MYDPDEAQSSQVLEAVTFGACSGWWQWFNGGKALLVADGTLRCDMGPGGSVSWRIADPWAWVIDVTWRMNGEVTWIDTMRLSDDLLTLAGANQRGMPVSARRTSGPTSEGITNSTWILTYTSRDTQAAWTVCFDFGPEGSVVDVRPLTSNAPADLGTARWRVKDDANRVIEILWTRGAETDTDELTLTWNYLEVSGVRGAAVVVQGALQAPSLVGAPAARLEPVPAPTAPYQAGWAACTKCGALSFGANGACAAGGKHAPGGSLRLAPAAAGDARGVSCRKCCGVLVEDSAGQPCAYGGKHFVQGSGSYAVAVADPSSAWRRCSKCALLYLEGAAGSRCAAGESHAPAPGASYRVEAAGVEAAG